MKKKISLLIALLMVVALFTAVLPQQALAAPEVPEVPEAPVEPAEPAGEAQLLVEITKVEPASMFTGGDASVGVQIKNTGTADATNVNVSIGGKAQGSISSLAAGASESKTYTISVSESMLDTAIPVTVEYESGAGKKSEAANITISKKSANVNVNAVVSVDQATVPQNTKVDFTFAVENKSDVNIEKVTIKAKTLNGGKAVNKAFSLAAGRSTIVTYTGTIMKSIKVAPVITFTAAGKEYTQDLNTLEVTMSSAAISVIATPEKVEIEAGGEAESSLNLQNTGNIDFQSISITDSDGNTVAPSASNLPQGGSVSAKAKLSPAESKQLTYTVTATGSDGQTYTYTSGSVDITVAAPEVIDYQKLFQLSVKRDDSKLESEKKIGLTIKLANKSEGDFTNVVITEGTLGNIDTQSKLAAGDTREITLEQEVAQNVTYVFKATATDPEGNALSTTSEEILVDVGSEEEEENKGSSGGIGTLVWIIVAIVVLIIGVGVALLVLVIRDRKKRAQEKQHAQRTAGRAARTASAAGRTQQRQRRSEPRPEPAYIDEEETADDFEPEDEEDEYDDLLDDAAEQEQQPTVRRRVSTSKRIAREDIDDRSSF